MKTIAGIPLATPMYKQMPDGSVHTVYPNTDKMQSEYLAKGYTDQHIHQEYPKNLGWSLADGSRVTVHSKAEEAKHKEGETFTKERPAPRLDAPAASKSQLELERENELLKAQLAQAHGKAMQSNRKAKKDDAS